MTNLDSAASFDAEQLKEDIGKGETKKPKVNLEADYELAQEFSVSEVDKTGAGVEAAKAATESKFELNQPQSAKPQSAESTGNPEDFLEMAKDVKPAQ
ncbi:MAG: hypothetical protein HY785_07070 [Oscillatoriophycideae cyanobacterium NC_groundwater_1537_Pr4_S-0.65um_50_18]|nr:hypothetical protein [Oscillatoriophycideae cyanobacterium NC_groundwater_1537_Pr4_S-0.65um_50_18]